jgi:hypothetical protein
MPLRFSCMASSISPHCVGLSQKFSTESKGLRIRLHLLTKVAKIISHRHGYRKKLSTGNEDFVMGRGFFPACKLIS